MYQYIITFVPIIPEFLVRMLIMKIFLESVIDLFMSFAFILLCLKR